MYRKIRKSETAVRGPKLPDIIVAVGRAVGGQTVVINRNMENILEKLVALQRHLICIPEITAVRHSEHLSSLPFFTDTWGLMYKGYVLTKKWRTHFFTSTIRCIKSEMTLEMCGASRQLQGCRTHFSTAVDSLATPREDVGKLL